MVIVWLMTRERHSLNGQNMVNDMLHTPDKWLRYANVRFIDNLKLQ